MSFGIPAEGGCSGFPMSIAYCRLFLSSLPSKFLRWLRPGWTASRCRTLASTALWASKSCFDCLPCSALLSLWGAFRLLTTLNGCGNFLDGGMWAQEGRIDCSCSSPSRPCLAHTFAASQICTACKAGVGGSFIEAACTAGGETWNAGSYLASSCRACWSSKLHHWSTVWLCSSGWLPSSSTSPRSCPGPSWTAFLPASTYPVSWLLPASHLESLGCSGSALSASRNSNQTTWTLLSLKA